METTDRFVTLVREYVALIEDASAMRPYELLTECSSLLTEIYLLGSRLPKVDPSYDEDAERPKPDNQMGRLMSTLGKYHFYHLVYDPIYDEEAGGSSLADDLSDIHFDLKRSLIQYDAGDHDNALWEWRFDMRHHAGEHIVAALRPIHFLIYDHMDRDYINEKART